MKPAQPVTRTATRAEDRQGRALGRTGDAARTLRPVSSVRRLAKRSRWLVCAANVVDDQRSRLAARNGAVASTSGSTHSDLSLEESLAYIDAVYGDYIHYGGLGPGEIEGAEILELGPGDNLGVALRFLGAGAARVIALDKFASVRDPEQQRDIYAEVDPSGLRKDPGRLRAIEGVAVEDAAAQLGGESFDLIVSRAVLEHLHDLDAAFASMDALLRPGGSMLHKVDFRDHGMFTGGGMHELTFLTIPDRLYELMSRNSGRPNRRLVDWYREKLGELGYDSRILVTHAVGAEGEVAPHEEGWAPRPGRDDATIELVRQIRPKLLPRFRSLPDADLAVSGIFIVARKPM
jgi:SAM-dependent methyltransferase